MGEKINIFDVEIPCIKAKEAMIRAMDYMEQESLNTIELLSMKMLLNGQEDTQWKEQLNGLSMVLPGSVEILEAAQVKDSTLLRETDDKLFLRMFMKYMQKNHKKLFLLAESEEKLDKAEELLIRQNRGIQIIGKAVITQDGELIQNVINAINGTETDCILSVLSSPFQEQFIQRNKALLNARVWLGCGTAFRQNFEDMRLNNRIRHFVMKRLFRYRVGKQNSQTDAENGIN
nr:WecB/TagA/CpsF family glycosyltransferase [uncultured Mediterraneibacter sp.]